MRRPIWFRLFIALWAVWFNAALLEAPGVHTCALHSGAAASGHSHGSADAAHMHGMHQASSQNSHDSDAGACTCLGVCCGVSPFVAAHAAPTIAAHYAAIAPRRIGNAPVTPGIERPYARPFANGPPSFT